MDRNIKLVIFDLDGTLVDAYPAITRSFNRTMRMFGLPAQSGNTIKRAVGWGDRNLLRPFVPSGHLSRALAAYRAHHTLALGRGTKFLPGTKGILRFLKSRGYKIALASNRPTKFSHIILEHLNIKRYFDYILCGDKVKKAKPYPDMLLAILKKLRVRPPEAVYAGDMTVDVQAGRRARIRTVAIAGGSSSRRELQRLKPYRIVKSVAGLKQIIQHLNGPSVR